MGAAYTIAYEVLVEALQSQGGPMSIPQVQNYFESTPRLVFPPGTTTEKVLQKLEHWELVRVENGCVSVIGQ